MNNTRMRIKDLCLLSLLKELNHVQLFVTPWTTALQASLFINDSWSLLKVMSIQPSLLCHTLLLLPSIFPSIRVFSDKSVLHIRWPKYWNFSFSISPSNIQDWFPLGWTGLISLQSKGLSRVFSSTTFQKHQFFGSQLSLWSNSHIHTWPPEKRGSPVWQLILCVNLTGSEDQLIGLTSNKMLPWR